MMLIRILRDELGTDFRKVLSFKKLHDVFLSGMIIDISFPLCYIGLNVRSRQMRVCATPTREELKLGL